MSVFDRVVVPVEFDPSEDAPDRGVEVGDHEWVAVAESTVRALELACALSSGGELCVVHATPDFRDYATWMSPERIKELDREASAYSAKVLVHVAERHCTGVSLRYVLAPGKPLDVILDATRKHAADAIVLAASGRGRVDRAFLGSTADKVIRQAPCPVLVVPSTLRAWAPARSR